MTTRPGNVRELKNALERALLLATVGGLRAEELLPAVAPHRGATGSAGGNGVLPFPATLRTITRAAVTATLERCSGNRGEAARRLRISPRRLRRIMDGTTGASPLEDDAPSGAVES